MKHGYFIKPYMAILSATCFFSLEGCALAPEQKAIDTRRISEVVDDVKRQVSIYVSEQNSDYNKHGKYRFSEKAACGNGMIDYDITQVKLDLLTTYVSTTSGDASVTAIPVPIPIPIGGGISLSNQNSNTQELVIVSKPLENRSFKYAEVDDKPAPLAEVMKSLKNSLKKIGKIPNRICMQSVPGGEGDSSGNVFKIAIETVDDGTGKLSVGLAPLLPLGLTASQELKSTAANTITFVFKPHVFK